MKILQLRLLTNRLELEKTFYTETLGFELIDDSPNHFRVKIGWSELTFEKSLESHSYHYCFLIPSNKLSEALEWLSKRVDIIVDENGGKTQVFENWNAESFYFLDASGNIAEFIVRHDLENHNKTAFNIDQVLCINEIGTPTRSIAMAHSYLQEHLKTDLWKGDLVRFATIGGQEGLLLLPNFEVKVQWFPTDVKIKADTVEAVLESKGHQYHMKFMNEKFEINPIEN